VEINPCTLCGAGRRLPFLQSADRFSKETFRLVQCDRCGLVSLSPSLSPGELARYYPPAYEPYRDPEEQISARERKSIARALAIQLDFIERYAPRRGRLLDVGCATGGFLRLAQSRGWQASGIEPGEQAARIAQQRYGLEVRIGTLESEAYPAEQFDVITLWDVLEHLPNPKSALLRLRDWLKEGGLLVFSIPNLESFDCRLFGPAWIGWDAPRHLNLFPQQTVKTLLSHTGFEPLAQRCIVGGKGTFFLSLATLTQGSRWEKALPRAYPLLSACLWPYRQISYLLSRGPILTYVARKKGR
jgi:SAM-dependent methyltransferase